ncbi:MAG: class II aldolase/adducin family protein [Candidatus Wallbacteria bacterium]|nr:class II aldolase/adducin family protein [Candidatus Wallbacteria bacterium]
MFNARKEIAAIGQRLFAEKLNHSHSGNISSRCGDSILITRTGSQTGYLQMDDIVEVNIHASYAGRASMEYPVHKAIYLSTDAKNIVHCHPPVTIALSLDRDFIEPVDAEGRFYFRKIPILSVDNAIASDEVAARIPELFAESPVVVVRGHGVFSIGRSLEEAYKFVSSLEASALIIWYSKR